MDEQPGRNSDEEDFLTTREAALLLGVSLRTVQLWSENSILRTWKTTGGHRRISRSSVEELIKQQHKEVSSSKAKLNVVIVEDELVQREIYQLRFEEWGLPVNLILAEDGFEGMLEIGRSRPDVIISDLCMPGIDGFQMIRAIRDDEEMRYAKIIAVTSLNKSEIEENGGLPAGVLVLHKSSSFKVLEKLIHDIYVLKYGR